MEYNFEYDIQQQLNTFFKDSVVLIFNCPCCHKRSKISLVKEDAQNILDIHQELVDIHETYHK